MAKGFMVVDVPNDCAHCSYADSDNKNWYCKWIKKDNDDYVLRATKPNWCPIHEFPKKRSEKDAYYPCDFYRAEGWNSCLENLMDATEVQNAEENA